MTITKPEQLDLLDLLSKPVLLTRNLGPRPCCLCHTIPPRGLEHIGATWQTMTLDGEWCHALICALCWEADPRDYDRAMAAVRAGLRSCVLMDNAIEVWRWSAL